MGVLNFINTQLNKIIKHRNNDINILNETILTEKVHKYYNNNIIISKNINKDILLNQDNLTNISKIACLLDYKFDKQSNFTEKQKELIIEACYSQFSYIKEKLDIDINFYLDVIDKNLKKIKISKHANFSVYSFSQNSITMSSKEDIYNDEFFYKRFAHELNHCYSYSKEKIAYFKTNFLKSNLEIVMSKHRMEEFETEYLQLEMTKRTFPEFVKYTNNYQNKFSNGEVLKTNIRTNTYEQLIIMSELVNNVMGDKLIVAYLDKDINKCINNSYLDEKTYDSMLNLGKSL